MGIREALNQNPRAATVITFAVIFSALAYIGLEIYRNRTTPPSSTPTRAYYTPDDGATTFVEVTDRTPPFDHNGRSAVRAHLFTCDGGRTRFVAYLERLDPAALPNLPPKHEDQADYLSLHLQVKPPLSSTPWLSSSDANAVTLVFPPCKDGSTASPVNP